MSETPLGHDDGLTDWERGLLKDAALEISGVALEIRDGEGREIYANALGRAWLASAPNEAPDHEDGHFADRALLIQRRTFVFAGRPYRVGAAVDVDAQRRLQDELFQRAYFDPLTGLPNRELCDRAITDLMRTSPRDHGFAVAVVDIDKFGQINAFYGSTVGDALICRIAERIAQEIRADDLIARTGGNELCLLLPAALGHEEIANRVRKIVERIEDPYFIDGAEIFASATAGVSFWPRDDQSSDGLRQKAKAALTEARRATGVRARLFEPALEEAELGRAKLEMSLRAAIRDRRIGCAFQPKVDFRANRIDSLEVLMRWRDEDGSWNSPGDFLDLAHKVGLTNDITQQVFEETIASLDTISETFSPGLHIGFNISARQAGDARFMRRFAADLAATGQAHRFVLELTEEAFLPASQFQSRVLPMLREIGAKISIDDFGSGFSSLSTLADITADEVKVDRSLIVGIDRKPRNQSLLRAIESICAALGAEVMVEGVETADELAYLRDFTDIRVAQGFFLGRPIVLPASSAAASLASSRGPDTARERATANSRTVERRSI